MRGAQAASVASCKLRQNANEGCNSCASLVSCFTVVVIRVLLQVPRILSPSSAVSPEYPGSAGFDNDGHKHDGQRHNLVKSVQRCQMSSTVVKKTVHLAGHCAVGPVYTVCGVPVQNVGLDM